MHASIHTHEVSETTLPILLRLGTDTPINVVSALLEAIKPPKSPVFTYFGPGIIGR